MRVLVIGAYGLIGAAVMLRLVQAGYEVIGCGRAIGTAARRLPLAEWIEGDLARDSTERWRARLQGIDAVVHAAGILQDGLGDDVAAVQRDGSRRLYEACLEAGVRRIVHISAIGADRAAPTRFMATKAETDARLMASPLDCIVLRPALVVGRAAYGGTALLRALAALPGFTPLPPETGSLQVIDADDVADAVLACLDGSVPSRMAFDLAHPEPYELGDIIARLRAWLGLPRARRIVLPHSLVRIGTALGDAAGWLGWRNPMRSTALAQITAGVVGDPGAWIAQRGRVPAALDGILANRPATAADLWHARLYLLKPAIFAALCLFWTATGAIALTVGWDAAGATLRQAGLGPLAPAAAVIGAVVDIALGVLVAFRRTAPAALVLMGVVTLGYLAFGSILLPSLWSDPLGPLLKVLPTAFLIAVAAALLPSR